MKPLISIIVPIYNVDAYLYRGIQSLMGQTLKNIEIICIDDASTDSSYSVIENLAQKDKRIKLIKNDQNMGVAHTRNLGLKIATAEYVAFLDPDDWFDLDFLEKLYNKATKEDLDIVKADIKEAYFDGSYKELKSNKLIIKAIENNQLISSEYNHGFGASIYKKDYLETNNITFPNLSNGEDIVFLLKAVCLTTKIGCVANTYYNYYQRPNSASNKIKEKNAYSVLEHFKLRIIFLNSIEITRKDYDKHFDVIRLGISGYWKKNFASVDLSTDFYQDYDATVLWLYQHHKFNPTSPRISSILKYKSARIRYMLFGVIPLFVKYKSGYHDSQNSLAPHK